MDKDQLDRIERKLNYVILVAARPDFWRMFEGDYKGWNALSAFDDIIKKKPDYLKS